MRGQSTQKGLQCSTVMCWGGAELNTQSARQVVENPPKNLCPVVPWVACQPAADIVSPT